MTRYVVLIRGTQIWDVRVAGNTQGLPFTDRADADKAAEKLLKAHPGKSVGVFPITTRTGR